MTNRYGPTTTTIAARPSGRRGGGDGGDAPILLNRFTDVPLGRMALCGNLLNRMSLKLIHFAQMTLLLLPIGT